MMIEDMKIQVSNYSKLTKGQRDYPYWFFYPLPILTLSRTNSRERFSIHLGFLWFTLTIKFMKK